MADKPSDGINKSRSENPRLVYLIAKTTRRHRK